jgi:hypothetical protein
MTIIIVIYIPSKAGIVREQIQINKKYVFIKIHKF